MSDKFETLKNNPEKQRLMERADNKGWKRWGPYLSERQWGTVREDYSSNGDAWNFISHEKSRSKAYRWGEDGIGGFSDDKQFICVAFSFWNHKDPILKERLFGLTNNEANHGEDVKELYYYLDSSPTHSYMKMLYKYPQSVFPYEKLRAENGKRGKLDKEFEIVDTGVFDDNAYFDIFIEYAKVDKQDTLFKLTVWNRGENDAPLTILPTLWFRNYWSWGYKEYSRKPALTGISNNQVEIYHPVFDRMKFYCKDADSLIFTENNSNNKRIFGTENESHFVKDAFHDYIVKGNTEVVNHNKIGTKVAAVYEKTIPAGQSETIWLRLSDKTILHQPFEHCEQVFENRKRENDEFYEILQSEVKEDELKAVQRQAYAGMLWNKQFYYLNVYQWLHGDPKMPFDFKGRSYTRNPGWSHAYMGNILSMPDKWEYPWFAAWDLAFHTVTLAKLDSDFAKRQLTVILREYYMHPNGQIPAYEWNFSDVNPPVHAWATWKVYEYDKRMNAGKGDIAFLEQVFHKLLLNFTWWVNQKDHSGNSIFSGGFLGLDNIGVFDRNAQIPGIQLEQADATGWMGIYTLSMLKIAMEISMERPAYQDMASKFFEHFLYIAVAINTPRDKSGVGLWDEDDQFYYDKILTGSGSTLFLKIRSLVGLIPLCAVAVISNEALDKLPDFKRRVEWILNNRPDLASMISRWDESGQEGSHMLSLLRGHRMKMVFRRLFDETEFLSDYGIRSLSKYYLQNPYEFNLHGEKLKVTYTPRESDLNIMGGNSNWRGPIWFPLNYLIIDALHIFARYYGEDFEVEYPTDSGEILTLKEAAFEISERLIKIFRDKEGEKPVNGEYLLFNQNDDFKKYYLFHEYFDGDNGKGLGAAHQTGWTGLVADLIQEVSEKRANGDSK